MSDHSFSEESFPNIQSNPPLTQLEATSSHAVASCLGEETTTCLTTTSFQVAVESNKVPDYNEWIHLAIIELPVGPEWGKGAPGQVHEMVRIPLLL